MSTRATIQIYIIKRCVYKTNKAQITIWKVSFTPSFRDYYYFSHFAWVSRDDFWFPARLWYLFLVETFVDNNLECCTAFSSDAVNAFSLTIRWTDKNNLSIEDVLLLERLNEKATDKDTSNYWRHILKKYCMIIS